MSRSVLRHADLRTLEYITTHVFFPLKLPDGDDHNTLNDHALAETVASAAHHYLVHLHRSEAPLWHSVIGMLDSLHAAVQFESLDKSRIISQLSSMNVGDARAFLIRAQNAAVIFRKQPNVTIFESFELSPKTEDVMSSMGKLIRSFPGPAIEIPATMFSDKDFLSELVNFLVNMNDDILDAAPTSRKAQTTVRETRDTIDPRYITELLTGILRGIGHPADIIRISKRVGDDVVWNNSELPWRRSSVWLLVRVAIQTSLRCSTLGHRTYKAFMLFFMCCLAKENICAELPNSLLQAMSAKISRRLRKLSPFAPDWLSHAVLQTCTSLRSVLDMRWRQVQDAQRISLLWAPLSPLNLVRDIQLSFLSSGNYLHNSLANHIATSPDLSFNLEYHHRGTLDHFLSSDGAFFEEAYRTDTHIALFDVECAVEQGIDAWVNQVVDNHEACVKLEILANKYSSSARATYRSNPELLSIMLLTTIELWIALDKIAIRETPMLADYSPEVPISLLEHLLFYRGGNLHRLRCAYQYILHRHSTSKKGWSVFSPRITSDSFAVRFYRASSRLRHLKAQIEDGAQDRVSRKVAELEKANARHAELKLMAAMADHESAISKRGKEYHPNQCKKCCYERELKKTQIEVYEWPLPKQQPDDEAIVFELDCPVSFNMWRTATFYLLVDLCAPSVHKKSPYIQLGQYSALQPYYVEHPRSRITLGSDKKPFVVTHYKKSAIPSMKERVCVDNGLAFYGFDSRSYACAATALGREGDSFFDLFDDPCTPVAEASCWGDINKYCTYQLRSGPYQNLQKYVNSTSHVSNEVLADQASCHKDLLIHEFLAFGHLRSGSSLQWLNILRELRGRSLSFNRDEVHFLLAQAVSHVGPLEHAEWTWHQEIQQSSFCHALLKELEKLFQDVEGNWLEVVTMDTISFLIRRLLASNHDPAVSQKALGLLRVARSKVFSWIQELSDKLMETPNDEELRGLLRDAAAICRSTFDVDPPMMPEVLNTAEDIKALLSSATLVRHHTPANVSSLSPYSQLLLDRDRRLSLTLENVVRDVVQADPSDQGSKWTSLPSPNSRWLSCTTASTTNQRSQMVHLNLLDGSLMVGGRSLGRLPSEIQKHALYDFVFGKQVLEVIPGDLPGMDYSTRGRISDHRVYFSLRDENLLIRAIAGGSSEVVELIPPEKLEGDLPTVLIEGHVHWLNLTTSVMEIRPLDSLWESSPDNWKIDCSTPGRYWMRNGRQFLVDTRSRSWSIVASLLKPLEASQNLIVTVSSIDPKQLSSSMQLSVALPRYGLSFYMDEDGDLRSHNLREMVYDENQSIGAFFGLGNQLVLRPKKRDKVRPNLLIPRCVLIPEGEISFRTDGHHVRIEIDTRGSALRRITYQTYRVDTDLGCLAGNASLTNKLSCAYLHALTSGCGTDPLTGRTGTEEALSLLQSASCWSAMKLCSRDAELLHSIACLCPSRTWYPKHLKCMQKVGWVDLPVNSQHHGLYLASKAIKKHYERIQLFSEGPSSTLFQDFPDRDEQLLEHSARRAASLFPPHTFGQLSGGNVGVSHSARDLVEANSGEHRAYVATTIVYHRRASSTINKITLLNLLKSWTDTVSGDTTLSLRYDRSWLTPDLPLIWLEAYNLLRGKDERKWSQLLFSLPAMAYASPELSNIVPIFVAFAVDSRFRSEDPPHYSCYDLSEGYVPSPTMLRSYVSDCAHPFERSPESDVPATAEESPKELRKRRLAMYSDRLDRDADTTVQKLSDAWPCQTPPPCALDSELYNIGMASSRFQSLFEKCYHNLKLKEHFARVQQILDNVTSEVTPISTTQYSFCLSEGVPSCTPSPFTVDQILTRPVPSLPTPERFAIGVGSTYSPGLATLHRLISTVETNATNTFEQRYVSALRTSANHLASETSSEDQETVELPTASALEAHYAQCSSSYIEGLEHLKHHLGPRNESEQAIAQSGQWPRITAYTLFRCLASNSPVVISDEWKRCLIKLALLALELQRARRLLQLHLADRHEELWRELENKGCDGWNPEVHPDWLLVQLQGSFIVRRVQAEVANQMIAPSSGSNTAMQLNMGEGKSSVIVPIVVADLANGDQLVRVIVPKALTAQMFYLLTDRLGGLVNRRIYFVPFSRSLQVDHQQVASLHKILSDCMEERGVLVVQPEHVLSLRLVSVEKQLPSQLPQPDVGQLSDLLLGLQKWLHSHSRDVLDESDEILHVRYQLVYSIGRQQHIEAFPARWSITQQVLGLVKKHASSLRELFPLGVEHEDGPSGSFHHLRITHAGAGEQLVSWIARDVVDSLLPDISLGQLHSGLRDAIRNFISCEHAPPACTELVREYAQHTPLWGGLLLLRGLLADGILMHAFRKRRWRVDYGLAPTRTMLAVPYRAKDVPSQRAEFGHPDVAIILTCLSYYYGGLTEEQLQLSFETLLKQNDPTLDYDLWVRDCPDMPTYLQTLNGVNTKSLEQWNTSLFPLFSRNRATVDFYLASVVFPKEAKEFPHKLSCSGWDLVEEKERLVTGFSGTNDGQYLLPLHIAQRDPDHQRGTNAKVLSYLLQSENNHYMCMAGQRRTTHEFLNILAAQNPKIRVLLDVGAQMLDLRNRELAEAWLDINLDASAAIYFNEDDELTVRTRDGSTQLFLSSPFAQQLDQCVVYLDDAHTRGTDIKFPSGFRAAVTLGPKVTKDRLAQGCMRMRKLGHGHSIMFFAPLEVDRCIRAVAGKEKDPLNVVDTMDILHWAIHETCEEIRQRAPHWVQQGVDHTSRYSAWTSFCGGQLSPEALSNMWLQPEAKKLEDLYGPQNTSTIDLSAVPDIHQRCIELGVLSLRDVSMDEEQEREVIHEAEREREVERPEKATPATHSLHPDVISFVKTGTFPTNTNAFRPVFETLNATSAATDQAHVWTPFVLATTDFAATVSSPGTSDEYLRPVQWIVSAKRDGAEALVILSPYEVNRLITHVRSLGNVRLHLYTPRVTRSMKPCDDLGLYYIPKVPAMWTPPPWLMDQLNVFAGQLYLKDYATYMRLCRFLCVFTRDLQGEEGIEVSADGFIPPRTRALYLPATADTFQSSPINSLKKLMSLRRKGMRFSPTHMGKLLDGRLLSEDDFDNFDDDVTVVAGATPNGVAQNAEDEMVVV